MDIVCVSSKNEMTEGLFGMVCLFLCEALPILENMKVDVNKLKWDVTTVNYGDIFPHILEYTSEYVNPSEFRGIVPIPLTFLRTKFPQWVIGDDFNAVHNLFFKYFRV